MFNGNFNENGAWSVTEDHLAQMIELLGPIPSDLLSEGLHSSLYFNEDGQKS